MASGAMSSFKPQRLSYFHDALLIQMVDFPIYYIEAISERHLVIAGGGGPSKTGVHNQINILELIPTGSSCTAQIVKKFLTPDKIPDAIMSGSLMKDLPIIRARLVTGGSQPTIYHINFDSKEKNFNINDWVTLKDRSYKLDEVKSVKCIPNKILTGAIDGQLAIWDVGSDKIVFNRSLKAHVKEIDEIDVDQVSQQIVTLSRSDGKCKIWSLNNLNSIHEFTREFINQANEASQVKFSYRSCKYSYDSISEPNRSSSDSFLLIVCNSNAKNVACKLYRVNTRNFKDFTSIPVALDGVLAMTVSSDGRLAGLGTRSGTILVYDLRKLKQIYKLEGAHHNVITGLEFLSPKPESLSLTNSMTPPLLSVSIDRRVVLHRPKRSSYLAKACKVIFLGLFVYLVFIFTYKNFFGQQ